LIFEEFHQLKYEKIKEAFLLVSSPGTDANNKIAKQ